MHLFVLILLLIINSITIAMENHDSLYFMNPWEYLNQDYSNDYSADYGTCTKKSSPIAELSSLAQNIIDQDCTSLLNQLLLEGTNTHTWAARATLTQSKELPISYENVKRPIALHPDNHIIGTSRLGIGKYEPKIAITITKPTNHKDNHQSFFVSNACKIAWNIAINPTNPNQCAVYFFSEDDTKNQDEVYIIDLIAQKTIKIVELPNTTAKYFLSLDRQKPVIHDQTLFFVNNSTSRDWPSAKQINQYDMRSDTINLLYKTEISIESFSQHNGTPYIFHSTINSPPDGEYKDTISAIDIRNSTTTPIWISKDKSRHYGDDLICGKNFILLTNTDHHKDSTFLYPSRYRTSMNLINKATGTHDSFCHLYYHDYGDETAFYMSENDTLSHFCTNQQHVTTSQITSLSPNAIGSHIKTMQAAATLRALHLETNHSGPVCKNDDNALSLHKEDFSPELWAIIKAQNLRSSAYPEEIEENSSWCTIQ